MEKIYIFWRKVLEKFKINRDNVKPNVILNLDGQSKHVSCICTEPKGGTYQGEF